VSEDNLSDSAIVTASRQISTCPQDNRHGTKPCAEPVLDSISDSGSSAPGHVHTTRYMSRSQSRAALRADDERVQERSSTLPVLRVGETDAAAVPSPVKAEDRNRTMERSPRPPEFRGKINARIWMLRQYAVGSKLQGNVSGGRKQDAEQDWCLNRILNTSDAMLAKSMLQ
jgi:hypothetical protein